jgi:hypothetical protein
MQHQPAKVMWVLGPIGGRYFPVFLHWPMEIENNGLGLAAEGLPQKYS